MSSRAASRRGSYSDYRGSDNQDLSRSLRAPGSQISSADFVITVSSTVGFKLPPGSQSDKQSVEGDLEAGLSQQQHRSGQQQLQQQPQQQQHRREQPQQTNSSGNAPLGCLQALLQRTGAADGTADDATSDLVQPLLPPEPVEADSQFQFAAIRPPDHDPFPATTAARAAAAEVARSRAMAADPTDNFRAAWIGRSAAAAVSAVAGKSAEALRFERKLAFASGLSWVVNILLLVAKLYAYWLSHSKAVLASAADSAVDLVSQMVIAYADYKIRQQDPRFPVGQARLEAIGVLACACIMSVASFEVVQESVSALITAYTTGQLPVLHLGLVMYLVLGVATMLKCVCWAVCASLQTRSDSMLALAEDHLNDVMSNMCAILTALAAGFVPDGGWIDPTGAIAISVYIVVRWLAIAKQQVDKIVGRGAPAEFVNQLEALATSHHEDMGLDVIRAYHFGARYIVEMEVVLPATMTVRDSHDISLDLQHKVEQLEEVERAFVHVDYTRRDGLEHKVERELAIATALSTSSSGRITPGPDGALGSGTFTSKDSGPLASRDTA